MPLCAIYPITYIFLWNIYTRSAVYYVPYYTLQCAQSHIERPYDEAAAVECAHTPISLQTRAHASWRRTRGRNDFRQARAHIHMVPLEATISFLILQTHILYIRVYIYIDIYLIHRLYITTLTAQASCSYDTRQVESTSTPMHFSTTIMCVDSRAN